MRRLCGRDARQQTRRSPAFPVVHDVLCHPRNPSALRRRRERSRIRDSRARRAATLAAAHHVNGVHPSNQVRTLSTCGERC
jgi:hypothetical protein